MHEGINKKELELQVQSLVKNAKPATLLRPCSVGDGIIQMSASDLLHFTEIFNNHCKKYTCIKFVPASGAATRMFKHIYERAENTPKQDLEEFKKNFLQFPFISALENVMSQHGKVLADLIKQQEWEEIFDFLLTEKGLGYGELPKGIIPFHQYEEGKSVTAFEEHLLESTDYATGGDGVSRIHFTIAPHRLEDVKQFISRCFQDFPENQFDIAYSVQSQQTDMPALNIDNSLFYNEKGELLLRPSGHGALIHNLQDLDEDLIFIKNIDNVTTRDKRAISVTYKKVIGGLLIVLKEEITQLLKELDENQEQAIDTARMFIRHWFAKDFNGTTKEEVYHALNRPLRVCGMVKNQGEPGGGPFWVRDESGAVNKQIVEKSQVNTKDLEQARVLSEAGFFNPVDIVCCIKSNSGEKFNLGEFIDYGTSFVSEKSYQGIPIKAIELPGLWNGSMAKWNTVFVEVPIETFNPVKTVNDLLRQGHRSTYNPILSMRM